MSYAKSVADQLKKRHGDTSEVKGVLTGHGFKNTIPSYTSKPDVLKTEIQHQVLCPDDQAGHNYDKLYGK